jgi:serine/threonine-protein kinase
MLLDTHGGGDYVKILDFGIAKLRDKALDTLSLEKNLTNVGTVIGTPHYMSPEQCQGESADARSDIYSLGVVAYEMLTGVTPFVGKTPTGVAIKHVTEAPRPLTDLCPDLLSAVERVVLRALAKDPDARQQSALEFSQEFATALSGDAATSELTTSGTQSVVSAPNAAQTGETARFVSTGEQQLAETSKLAEQAYATQISTPPPTEVIPEATEQPVPAAKTEPKTAAKTSAKKPPKTAAQTAPKASPVTAPTVPPHVTTRPAAAPKKGLPITVIGIGAVGVVVLALVAWLVIGSIRKRNEAQRLAALATPVPTASVQPSAAPTSTVPTPPEGMVFVPGGEFTLGRDDGEPDERPSHAVSVKPFFLDQAETTNEQYQKFIDATGYAAPPSWKGGRVLEGAEKLPVTDVTWEDAMAYARWASKRLPTEEEWEFAARGTDGRLYPWGSEWQPDRANTQSKQGEKRKLEPVGQFLQGDSPYNVHDLSGNVWEWTASDYVAYPGGFIEPQVGYSNLKVIRGGSFESAPKAATATLRRGWPATRNDWPTPGRAKYDQTGFRCAQDAPQP